MFFFIAKLCRRSVNKVGSCFNTKAGIVHKILFPRVLSLLRLNITFGQESKITSRFFIPERKNYILPHSLDSNCSRVRVFLPTRHIRRSSVVHELDCDPPSPRERLELRLEGGHRGGQLPLVVGEEEDDLRKNDRNNIVNIAFTLKIRKKQF